MSWKILNKNTNQTKIIQVDSIINIGNISECEIYVNTKNSKNNLIQFILEENYIFKITEKKIEVSILIMQFDIFEFKFLISSLQDNFNIVNNKPSYHDTQKLYSSQEYIEALHATQKYLTVNNNFAKNDYEISSEEIVNIVSDILNYTFWKKNDIFNCDHRTHFRHLIWMVTVQISQQGLLTLPLLDNEISEIMVNEPKKIYLEKNGTLFLCPLQFNSDNELLSLIERICSATGRRIDESMPYCDARLPDGSRVHAIIPPLAINGPCLTIRKFPKHEMTPQTLLEKGSVTLLCFNLLKHLVENKNNILISGGTGSGKTTLLNCFSSFIPEYERIITIEDSAELKLQQQHVIRLECRAENIEKKGAVTMRDLIKNALRMRPDRIIVGECRGGEALDMLQAMNTGHDGSMTTVHANSPIDALRRLETLVLFAEFDLPSRAIREQISSAINYVVQQTRLPNGFRCVTQIHKLMGLCQNTGQFLTKELFNSNNNLNI